MTNIIKLINQSAAVLEKIADTHGVARANNITLLSEILLSMADEIGVISKELEELRRFKEEHGDDPSQSNEV